MPTSASKPVTPSPTHTEEYSPTKLGLALAIGVIAFFASGMLPFVEPHTAYQAQMAAAITAFVATCWLTNAFALGAVSLVPLALMPMLGVISLKHVAYAYAHPILWLFFGGFILALAIERWGLHRRIALFMIATIGVKPASLVLGFMTASATLSMWLVNTSITLMLLPIAMALVTSMRQTRAIDAESSANFGFSLLLGIAFASSIGGLGTPIGTAPNGIFLSAWATFEQQGAPAIPFGTWIQMTLPLVVVFVPAVWWLLTHWLAPVPAANPKAYATIKAERDGLPPMDRAEKTVLLLFAAAALLWLTRRDLPLGTWITVPGWWRLLPLTDANFIGDGSVAILIAAFCFVLPSGRRPGQAIMNWETAKTLPWDIIFLLAGGIAIAAAFRETGLALAVGTALKPWIGTLPPFWVVLLTCGLITFLTEVTSNTAMISIILPVLSAASVAAHIDPRLVMIPATLSASCAFMLPIATPPNAIVFASGEIEMTRMARVGIWFNLLGIVLIAALTWLWIRPLLGIQLDTVPNWLTK